LTGDRRDAVAAALPFAAFYGGVFLAHGVYLPFWPLWLEARGLSPGQIGLLLALASWIKVASAPAFTQLADRSGRGKATLIVLAGATLAAFGAFFWARDFWALLMVQLLAAATFHALVPLGESRTLAAVADRGLDYGRIRLWGSLTFVAGSLGAGQLITGRDPDLVLWLILAALAATLAATVAVPAGGPSEAVGAARRRPGVLLRDGRFLAFLAAASLLQASHAVYYGFSALHWRAAGLSEATIGWLWAHGVIAEVLLFMAGGALIGRVGPLGLLAMAGLGGALRWTVLAATTALPALLAAQTLHAVTFGAAHLGAMHFIAGRAPPGLSATAQGLYSAVSGGLVMGGAMVIAGTLFEAQGSGAYLAMAALSLGGSGIAYGMLRSAPARG
jgi:PPP family 3-phenylpropionic acid transporter